MALGVSCQTCCFYSPNLHREGVGQCRAHAPVLVMTEHGPRSQWPLTTDRGWCGDHAVFEE